MERQSRSKAHRERLGPPPAPPTAKQDSTKPKDDSPVNPSPAPAPQAPSLHRRAVSMGPERISPPLPPPASGTGADVKKVAALVSNFESAKLRQSADEVKKPTNASRSARMRKDMVSDSDDDDEVLDAKQSQHHAYASVRYTKPKLDKPVSYEAVIAEMRNVLGTANPAPPPRAPIVINKGAPLIIENNPIAPPPPEEDYPRENSEVSKTPQTADEDATEEVVETATEWRIDAALHQIPEDDGGNEEKEKRPLRTLSASFSEKDRLKIFEAERSPSFSMANPALKPFHEMIETEKTYVKRLEMIEMHYRKRLLTIMDTYPEDTILQKKEIQIVFLNVDKLFELSQLILKELKKIRRSDCSVGKWGTLFAKPLKNELIAGYSFYAERYEESSKFRKYLLQSNAKFAKFVACNEVLLGCTLESLLIEPVQRFMRYPLLLKEALRNLPDDHPEKPALTHAVEVVSGVCERINLAVNIRSSKRMVLILQDNLFKGKLYLFNRVRTCIRFGSMAKRYNKKRFGGRGDEEKKYFFVLFSDCLLYSSLSGDGKSASLKHILPLGGMRIKQEEGDPRSFKISNTYKNISVTMETVAAKESWIKDVEAAVRKLEEDYKRRAKDIVPFGDQVMKSIKDNLEPNPDDKKFADDFVIFPDETPWLSHH